MGHTGVVVRIIGTLALLSIAGAASAAPASTPTAKARLETVALKACQSHEEALIRRSTAMTDNAAKLESTFGEVSAKTRSYYARKMVPKGMSLASYGSLTADIDSKKTSVDTALTAAKTDVGTFSCFAENPKDSLVSFRRDMKAAHTALQDYRTSIKALVHALRQTSGDSL